MNPIYPIVHSLSFKIIFLLVAAAVSIFYASYAIDLFVWKGNCDDPDPNKSNKFICEKIKLRVWRWYQRFFNFLGSAVGFAALYYLITTHISPEGFSQLTATDLALAIVALLGITGLRPNALSRVSSLK